ncbi:MAG TPA: hypothetical protein VI306_19525 [Pyrinomonadaceae bacterium]
MNKINLGRVILGGLVTGFILNLGEFLLNEVIFVKQMEEMARQHNVVRPGTLFISVAVVLTFLLGIMIIFIYALIRQRLGAGVKTAIVAGLIGWFCVYFYSGILNGALFGIPTTLLVSGVVWGFAEYIIAAIAGAALYKEG